MQGRVLLAGESWMTHSIHQKGFDSFTTTEYVEGGHHLISALHESGWEVDYQPCHVAADRFPGAAGLSSYNCVILSDIGANTLALPSATFVSSQRTADRIAALADYVYAGGGLVMIGGYLSFAGIEGKARWANTPVEEVLPVTISHHDDRRELPAGVVPHLHSPSHPAASGIDGAWPHLLGYNVTRPREDAQTVLSVDDDPLLVVRRVGQGRTAAFMSDCAPHWAPPEFVQWKHYGRLWSQIIGWVAGAAGTTGAAGGPDSRTAVAAQF